MRNFILLSTEDFGKQGCERRIDMFPGPTMRVVEVSSDGAIPISSVELYDKASLRLD